MRLKVLLSILSLAVMAAVAALVPCLAPAGEVPTSSHYKVLAPIRHGNLSVFSVVAATQTYPVISASPAAFPAISAI